MRRTRSTSAAVTPYVSATWSAVMPYFSQARMRATCAVGMTSSRGGLARRCRRFVRRDGRRRGDRQHTRFADGFAGRCGFMSEWFDALGFGCKERLGRLTRVGAPLATIVAIIVLW